MIMETTPVLLPSSLPNLAPLSAPESSSGVDNFEIKNFHHAQLDWETRFLRHALEIRQGQTTRVAEDLGLPARTLRDRLRRCGLDPKDHKG